MYKQSVEPVKQVLFCEFMYPIESRVALLAADKQATVKISRSVNTGTELLLSLAIRIQVLIVLLTNVHVDLGKF